MERTREVATSRVRGRTHWRLWPPTILDRYLVSELGGPFLFGLTAFTLIFVATQLIAIGRLVSEEHAPIVAVVIYFLWDMPQYLLLVIPMAMLLGTLLAMQRLSGESEVTAMKAGGISLARIVAPLLAVGLIVSLFTLLAQEEFVPFANARAAYVEQTAIRHASPGLSNLSATTALPGGGKQVTFAGGFDASTQGLLNVTVIRYDPAGRPQEIIFADRARYNPPSWTFENATTYHFAPDGTTQSISSSTLEIDVGAKPSQIVQHAEINDPEQLSRHELADRIASGQLSPAQARHFRAVYASKLARPFAAFVFTLIAVPFGLRPVRGGGTGLGFGLAVAIVFVYYVISTVFLAVGGLAAWLAGPAAWAPNIIFTLIGGRLLLRRASQV